jgi:hypothetical protein
VRKKAQLFKVAGEAVKEVAEKEDPTEKVKERVD